MHPVARDAYLAALADGWADPGRLHAEGRRARLLLDGAREALAEALGARPSEVRLTPSHTGSLHAAISATSSARRRAGPRVVVSAVERAAVLAAAARAGEPVTVRVDDVGRVDLAAWAESVEGGAALAALQHANGEVGTLQPIDAAAEVTARHGVPLLVDAGASVGHVPVPPTWDLLAADPRDWGGVPGVAVLAVRSRVRTRPTGPEDEDPWAPGGANIPAAVAAAAALRAVHAEAAAEDARRRALTEQIRSCLGAVPDTVVAGDPVERLPHILTFSCLYVDAEALVTELDRRGFAVGSGSACTANTLEPSHVLAAMGLLTHGNVRVGLPRGVADDDVTRFCEELPDAVATVRAMVGATDL